MKGTRELAALLLLYSAGAVSSECSVNVSGTNFGVYYPTTYTQSSGEIVINCIVGIPYQIKLDAGMNSTNSGITRKMRSTSGVSTLDYNLYRDPSYIEVWGDGIAGTYIVSGTGTGGTEFRKIYGLIPSDQNVADGVYTDAVNVLVEW